MLLPLPLYQKNPSYAYCCCGSPHRQCSLCGDCRRSGLIEHDAIIDLQPHFIAWRPSLRQQRRERTSPSPRRQSSIGSREFPVAAPVIWISHQCRTTSSQQHCSSISFIHLRIMMLNASQSLRDRQLKIHCCLWTVRSLREVFSRCCQRAFCY